MLFVGGWGRRNPPDMLRITLDYLKNMCQSAFDNSGSFKSKEGDFWDTLFNIPSIVALSKNINFNINLNIRSTLE